MGYTSNHRVTDNEKTRFEPRERQRFVTLKFKAAGSNRVFSCLHLNIPGVTGRTAGGVVPGAERSRIAAFQKHKTNMRSGRGQEPSRRLVGHHVKNAEADLCSGCEGRKGFFRFDEAVWARYAIAYSDKRRCHED